MRCLFRRYTYFHILVVAVALSVSACAGSPGGYKPVAGLAPAQTFESYDSLHLSLSAALDLAMSPDDLERIGGLVATKIRERDPARFSDIQTVVATADTHPIDAPATTTPIETEPLVSGIALVGSAHAGELQPSDAERESVPAARVLQAGLEIVHYEEGNAFARLMLAGLGQIRIDAMMTLSDEAGRPLGAFEIDKTFAWGGLYGGVTSIHDVEHGFSEAVAAALLGDAAP